ncbi:MAG TPA: hypothetical protein VGD88_14130 [Opitutaceae bacterium]
MTLSEAYCSVHGCTDAQFSRRIFWACLHPAAVPFVPLLMVVRPGYFLPEGQLIAHAARATSLHALEEDIQAFRSEYANHRWTRRGLNFRLSTRRLRSLAIACFAKAKADSLNDLASA